ncbi:P-loop containing nucleoside triphosphate hydrolase protein, partial [Pavlovales sp. CCMP2436]
MAAPSRQSSSDSPLRQEEGSPRGQHRVVVHVRVRPLLAFERDPGSRGDEEGAVVRVDEAGRCVLLPPSRLSDKERAFKFDGVFGPTTLETELFATVAEPLLRQALAGYNATLLAYGQTGSGKTHTMLAAQGHSVGGATHAQPDSMEAGVIPRVAAALFAAIRDDVASVYTVRVSAVQVYNEQLFDLLPHAPLAPSASPGPAVHSGGAEGAGGSLPTSPAREGRSGLSGSRSSGAASPQAGSPRARDFAKPRTREGSPRAVSPRGSRVNVRLGTRGERGERTALLEGAAAREVADASALLRLIHAARAKLVVAETKLNRHSSRSHTVIQIQVERRERARRAGTQHSAQAQGGGGDGHWSAGHWLPASSGPGGAESAGEEGGGEFRARTVSAKLTLVDLAGSERVSLSGSLDDYHKHGFAPLPPVAPDLSGGERGGGAGGRGA